VPEKKGKELTPEQEMLQKIRLARTRANMSQDRTAYLLGVSQQTYSSYERGRNSLSVTVLFDLPAVLGCGIADLLPSAVVTEVDQRRSKDFRLEEIIEIFQGLDDDRHKQNLLDQARILRDVEAAGRYRAGGASLKLSGGKPPFGGTPPVNRPPVG
jgi:transcriptional regulator with XRE-family HTH domain